MIILNGVKVEDACGHIGLFSCVWTPPKVVNTHLTHSVTPCLGNFKHPNQLPLEALPFTQELLIVAPSP